MQPTSMIIFFTFAIFFLTVRARANCHDNAEDSNRNSLRRLGSNKMPCSRKKLDNVDVFVLHREGDEVTKKTKKFRLNDSDADPFANIDGNRYYSSQDRNYPHRRSERLKDKDNAEFYRKHVTKPKNRGCRKNSKISKLLFQNDPAFQNDTDVETVKNTATEDWYPTTLFDAMKSPLFGKSINVGGDDATFENEDSSDFIDEAESEGTTRNHSYSFLNRSPRIVGGREARSRSAPFFAIMLYWNYKVGDWEYMGCGGSLISSTHILTAAHCVSGRKIRNDAVYVHAYQPFEGNPDTPFHFSRVAKYTIHPSFQDGPNDSDVAIVTLATPVSNTDLITPILLARPSSIIEDGDQVSIYGFGQTAQDNDAVIHTLRVGTLPFISNTVCKNYYRGNQILPDMVCGGHPKSGVVDACQGDSGGPMTYRVGRMTYQVGTVSWGEGCGRARRPGVYSSTQYHFEWIQQTVCTEVGDALLCDDAEADQGNDSDFPVVDNDNGESGIDRSSNATEGLSIDPDSDGIQVCDNNKKRDGQTCRYGGECCSGICRLHSSTPRRLICKKRISRVLSKTDRVDLKAPTTGEKYAIKSGLIEERNTIRGTIGSSRDTGTFR